MAKKTPTLVFSGEYSKIFKNSFFDRTPLVATGEISYFTVEISCH